jgi:hypothetical protein
MALDIYCRVFADFDRDGLARFRHWGIIAKFDINFSVLRQLPVLDIDNFRDFNEYIT